MRLIVFAFASISLLLSSAASAQSLEQARRAFEQGRAAYESGDFETALMRFQEAHRITGNPEILYNVATSADRLRMDQVALEAYRGYLAARPGSEDRASVEGRIRVLERQVADARREEEERLAAEAATAEREAQAQAALAEARQARDPGPAPWIVAGAGAALAVGGAVLLIVAEVDAGCVSAPNGCTDGGPRWEDFSERYDRVPIFRGVGGAALGLGAAAMAAGLVWALAGGGGGEPEVAIGPGGVRVRGHF
ncbi:MAG: hypothetical protein SangKO_037630 [Sandaracinaceae bacterium]|nr:MAG: hypothetical protein EVA89_02585 [Sandaracinaceae bacterium]